MLKTAVLVAFLGAAGVARLMAPPSDFSRFHQKRFPVLGMPATDTITIAVEGEAFDVHLLGVDATPGEVKTVRPGENVLLYLEAVPARTSGGKLLAYVFLENHTLLNEQQVVSGAAFVDRRYGFAYRRTFEQAEEAAMRQRLGVWATVDENCDPPMPEWRRRWRAEMSKPAWERTEWRRSDEP